MKKRMTIMGIGLALVFGGLIAFNLIRSLMMSYFFSHHTPPAVTVSASLAQAVDWQPHISAVGNFAAIDGVEVNSEASGKVVKVDFDSGLYVEKDSPLVTIDDSVEQAELKFNLSELTLKELDYKRQTDLLKKGATPGSLVDEAKAHLQQAQAKVEQIQAQINRKHIKAPFTGRLGISQINLGQYITPGQTSIVSLQSLDPLYLEFYLPEQWYKSISLNQNLLFAVEEFPQLLFRGTITAVNSKIDLNTHNLLIQATVPNCSAQAIKNPRNSKLLHAIQEPRGNKLILTCHSDLNKKSQIRDYLFIPGMFASIAIDQPAKPNTVIVPSTAISYSLYGSSVYKVEKNKEGSLFVTRVYVTTGEQGGNYTVIKKGIQAGTLVVTTGDLKLQSGTAVVINNSVPLNTDTDPNTLGE